MTDTRNLPNKKSNFMNTLLMCLSLKKIPLSKKCLLQFEIRMGIKLKSILIHFIVHNIKAINKCDILLHFQICCYLLELSK